jgi:hypothetical protein
MKKNQSFRKTLACKYRSAPAEQQDYIMPALDLQHRPGCETGPDMV